MKEELIKEMEGELKELKRCDTPPCYIFYLKDGIVYYLSKEKTFDETIEKLGRIINFNFKMMIFEAKTIASKNKKQRKIIVILGIDKESNYRVLNFYDKKGNLLCSFENEDFDKFLILYLKTRDEGGV